MRDIDIVSLASEISKLRARVEKLTLELAAIKGELELKESSLRDAVSPSSKKGSRSNGYELKVLKLFQDNPGKEFSKRDFEGQDLGKAGASLYLARLAKFGNLRRVGYGLYKLAEPERA